MTTLAKHWRCPKCGYEQHEPIRVSAAAHPCHVNDKGERRTIPKNRDLVPVVDWSAPAGGWVQLTLEGTT
jgi:hypothetical protein